MTIRPRRSSWSAVGVLAVSLAVLICSCGGEVTPEITAGVDGCGECGMVIDRTNEACGTVHEGRFEPFCSPSCLLARYDEGRATGLDVPSSIFFADYHGGGFSAAETTAFLLTDHVPTVMNARVITFPSTTAAEAMQHHADEVVTDWIGYRVLRGRPDAVVETTFSAAGMEPESVSVAKGDIVLWRFAADGIEEDLIFRIKGYPEVGPVKLGTDGGTTEVRFLAIRPGAGFPIENNDGDTPLGMLKVTGAHTADEAAQ